MDGFARLFCHKIPSMNPFQNKISLLTFFLTNIGRARFVDWPKYSMQPGYINVLISTGEYYEETRRDEH